MLVSKLPGGPRQNHLIMLTSLSYNELINTVTKDKIKNKIVGL